MTFDTRTTSRWQRRLAKFDIVFQSPICPTHYDLTEVVRVVHERFAQRQWKWYSNSLRHSYIPTIKDVNNEYLNLISQVIEFPPFAQTGRLAVFHSQHEWKLLIEKVEP